MSIPAGCKQVWAGPQGPALFLSVREGADGLAPRPAWLAGHEGSTPSGSITSSQSGCLREELIMLIMWLSCAAAALGCAAAHFSKPYGLSNAQLAALESAKGLA